MDDDELRKLMAAADPASPSRGKDPFDPERARALMEEIMATQVDQPVNTRPRVRTLTAVAAALAMVVGAAAVFGSLGASGDPLVLTSGASDPTASCLPFDVETLADMSPAFAGTVIELTDSVATLEVDRWYAGEEAEVVEIQYTPGFEALIGTPTLEVGQRYLITAANGVVNGCGYSGLATPEFEAAFEQAFAS
ncbi:MAG TPA: hypothetical protein VJR05_01425 [Acidimicrobiia bacterium]|nr:hypothetical protein [Acidimicrobiia bacterium]